MTNEFLRSYAKLFESKTGRVPANMVELVDYIDGIRNPASALMQHTVTAIRLGIERHPAAADEWLREALAGAPDDPVELADWDALSKQDSSIH